jgi:hypothetical protein
MESYERKAIRVWLREVMDTKGWSAYKWANLAGTSPTNITRFLNQSKHQPSSGTIAKLATVAGTIPNLSVNSVVDAQSTIVTLYNNKDEPVRVMSVFGVKGELRAYELSKDYPSFGVNSSQIIVAKSDNRTSAGQLFVARNDDEIILVKSTDDKRRFLAEGGSLLNVSQLKLIGRVVQIITNLDD